MFMVYEWIGSSSFCLFLPSPYPYPYISAIRVVDGMGEG